MKNNHTLPVLMLLVVLLLSSAGCIKVAQNALAGATAGESTASESGSAGIVPPGLSLSTGVNAPSPVVTDSVTEFSPTQTPSEYPIQHATRVSSNQLDYLSFLNWPPDFEKTYTMTGYPVGLMVNVTKGPLYVVYTVTPENDCVQHPEDCRGTTTVPVNRPYMTITIINSATNGVVAEDGYSGGYSSDTGTYTYTGSGYSTSCGAGGQGSVSNTYSWAPNDNVCSEPVARYIPVYAEGQFQVIINGMYCSTSVSIITGASAPPASTPGDP